MQRTTGVGKSVWWVRSGAGLVYKLSCKRLYKGGLGERKWGWGVGGLRLTLQEEFCRERWGISLCRSSNNCRLQLFHFSSELWAHQKISKFFQSFRTTQPHILCSDFTSKPHNSNTILENIATSSQMLSRLNQTLYIQHTYSFIGCQRCYWLTTEKRRTALGQMPQKCLYYYSTKNFSQALYWAFYLFRLKSNQTQSHNAPVVEADVEFTQSLQLQAAVVQEILSGELALLLALVHHRHSQWQQQQHWREACPHYFHIAYVHHRHSQWQQQQHWQEACPHNFHLPLVCCDSLLWIPLPWNWTTMVQWDLACNP